MDEQENAIQELSVREYTLFDVDIGTVVDDRNMLTAYESKPSQFANQKFDSLKE